MSEVDGVEVVDVKLEEVVGEGVSVGNGCVDGEVAGLTELLDVGEAEEVEVGEGELVVGAAVLVEGALGTLVVAAAGGMTLKLSLAPQSAREVPSGQQPASVQ
jgi:hypothetical protein